MNLNLKNLVVKMTAEEELKEIDQKIREKHKLLADERRKLNELTEQRTKLLEKIR